MEHGARRALKLPSPRALARGGEGSGVGGSAAFTCAAVLADRPPTPDPSPPLRGGRGDGSALAEPVIGPAKGRTRWLACPGRRNLSSDSNFKQQMRVRILAARCCPRFAFRCPSKEEGAGNAGCALHPRSRVQNGQKKAHTSIQVQRRQSDIPCAMALRLTSRSPRRIGLCCLRRLRIAGSSAPGRADLPSADLTPTTEASGPHDFTVRFSTARQHVL